MYDVVAGPVAMWWTMRAAYVGYDQFSFHTAKAVDLLDHSDKRQFDRRGEAG